MKKNLLNFCMLVLIQVAGFPSIAQNIFSGEPVQVVGSFNGYTTTPYGSDYRTTSFRRVSVNTGIPTDGRGQLFVLNWRVWLPGAEESMTTFDAVKTSVYTVISNVI